jgi:membrane protein
VSAVVAPGVSGFWQRYARCFVEAVRRYSDDRFGPRAQAIAYSVLFSLIPFAATAIAGFGLVLRDDDTRRRVTQALTEALAVTTGYTGFIQDTTKVVAAGSRAVGPVSLVVALWSAGRAASVVRQALEDAWRGDQPSRFLYRRLSEAGMMAAVIVLLLASTVASGIFGALIALGSDRFGPNAPWLRLLAGAGGVGLALGFSVTAFVLTYKFVPQIGQSWRGALVGGVPAGLAFEVLRVGFTVFVARFAGLNPIYGALSSVFLFLAWANAAATILLLGVEMTVTWERSDGGRSLAPLRTRVEQLRHRIPRGERLRRMWRSLIPRARHP